MAAAMLACAGAAFAAETSKPAVPAPAAPAQNTEAPTSKPADKEAKSEPEKQPQAELEFYSLNPPTYLRKEGVVIMSGSAWVAEKTRGMLLEAEHIVLWQKERQAYAVGGVRMTEKDGRILADELFYDFSTNRGRATGVRMEVGKVEEIPGNATGPAEMPKFGGKMAAFGGGAPNKWYIGAPEIRRAGPGRWQIIKPSVSSCDFGKPHWRFEASSADYYPGDMVQSFNNVLYIGPVPVFYVPYMARDMAHDYPWTTWQVGHSTDWGYYALSKWGLGLPHERDWMIQPGHLFFDADWRQYRGGAYGLGMNYDALPRGGGYVDYYGLREDTITANQDNERAHNNRDRLENIYGDLRNFGAPKIVGRPKLRYDENLLFAERRAADGTRRADADLAHYADQDRENVTWFHQQYFLEQKSSIHDERIFALDFTAELNQASDRDFEREYFRNDYRADQAPLTYAMLRHQADQGSLWLLVEPRINSFNTETEYLPQLRGAALPQRLPGGFFLSGAGDVGYLRRRFDEDSGFEDFESGRAHARMLASRPLALGPAGFTPYVGVDHAWYSDSRDGANLMQDALLYGADSSMRIYGIYGLDSESMNVHDLRHVVEPRIFYRGVAKPSERPVDVLDFDEVEDLNKTNVVGAGLFQKLQTKRRTPDGKEKVFDLAGIDFEASGFIEPEEADRLNAGDRLLPFRLGMFANITDNIKVWNHTEIDAHGVGVSRTSEGITYTQKDLFSATLAFSTITPDPERDINASRYLSSQVQTALGDHWRLGVSGNYEFARPNEELGRRGFTEGRIALVRDFHCWVMGVDYTVTRDSNDRRNHSIGFTFSAAPKPTNVVRGSDQLLIESPAFTREPCLWRPSEPAGELRVVPPETPPSR